MAITSEMVRKLRDMTGAAMMDCKKALDATNGDMDAAIDHLRKAGLKTASKKAGRETGEGRVAAKVSADGKLGAILLVRCETDFVANTPDFQKMVEALLEVALANDLPDNEVVETFQRLKLKSGETVQEHLQQVIGKLGENIRVGGVGRLHSKTGVVGSYVHHNNKSGALSLIETSAERAKSDETLKRLCQHITASRPAVLDRAAVPAADREREKAVHAASEDVLKKPAEHREKIILGKLEKFYADVTLLEQPWIFDDKQNVAKAVQQALGAGSKPTAFVRLEV
jgi:elongation factor Ts